MGPKSKIMKWATLPYRFHLPTREELQYEYDLTVCELNARGRNSILHEEAVKQPSSVGTVERELGV